MSRDEMRECLTAVKRDALKDPRAVVREEILEEVMQYADVSKDGQIERRHLLAAIKKYKCMMNENEHLKGLFEKHDRDHSGDLNKEQVFRKLRSNSRCLILASYIHTIASYRLVPWPVSCSY